MQFVVPLCFLFTQVILCHRPLSGRLLPLPEYVERFTEEPPLTVPSMLPAPLNSSVPPLTETPDFSVVVPLVDTTNVEPPLPGVLKASARLLLL